MRLTQLDISKIVPNPDNPRGIDIQTEDEKLSYLKDSIKHFGVMVPIVVSQRGDSYQLIDGERRFWACRALGLKKLPAFVLDEEGALTDKDILFRMFQIHHNREQWGPVQQCHALEALYNTIARSQTIRSVKDERARLKAIAEELVKATGIEERTALTRVYFLRWPSDIKQRLYDHPGEEGYWYICEIEEKIIIPALVNYPEYFQKVPVEEVRKDLFEKLEKHSVEKSTDVRRVAPFFRAAMPNSAAKKKVQGILNQLHSRKEMTYAEAQDEFVHAFPEFLKREPVSPRKLHSLMRSLQIALDDFDVSAVESAKRRAKATKRELSSAICDLITSLEKFNAELGAGGDDDPS
jgi:ParB/RepB/Spo0J family partition protein